MKTRIFYLLLTLISVQLTLSAQTDQRINLAFQNEALPTVLKKLEQASSYRILFTYDDVQSYQVTATLHDSTIFQAIEKVLEGKPLTYTQKDNQYIIILSTKVKQKPLAIRGTVMNEKNEPMPFCNVLLLAPDSTFVNGCVTKEDGSFAMAGVEGTPYLLKTSYIGYVTSTQPADGRNLIQLLPDALALEEVTVTAERPLIEASANGLKANVVGTSLAKMGTAGEMLSHLPFVTGKDGSYTVLGHGSPLIYINNRKVRDMGELDRLRADEIVSAEVITTPGAEYAADVAAIIRIKTIKQRGQGWSGRINLNYNQGHWAKANQQVNLNYRTGGLDLFSRISVFENNQYGKTTDVIQINETNQWDITINDTQTMKSRNLYLEAGFNYEINEKHSFGMRYQPMRSLKDYTARSWGENIASCNGAEADWLEFNQSTQGKTGWDHSISAYYTGIIGKWKIDFDADYLNNRKAENQIAEDESRQDIHSHTNSSSKLYAAKLQANVSLGKGKLSFGSEGTLTERLATFTQSGYSADADDLIKQKALAGFANYAISFGKWKANAGVRYEHRKTDYYDEGIRIAQQSPTYNDFIPTASLSWADNGFGLSLSYRMMKTYPAYFHLSNAISYRNQYEYDTGNPLLEPCQTYYLNLTASYKWLYATLQYKRVKNESANICMPYNEETHPGVLLFGSANVATYNGYSLNLVAAPQIGCWRPQFTAYVSLSPTDGRNLGIKEYRKQPYFLFEWDNSFQFSNGWFLNIQADYHPACRSGFAVFHTTGQVNARVSKSFLKDNAMTVALTASDIFRTGNYYFHIYGINSSVKKTIYRDFQRIGIQLSYKFNATKSKYKGTGAGQSEKSRL